MNVRDHEREGLILLKIYEESGHQIRSNEQITTAFLAFYGIALAALLGVPAIRATSGVWLIAGLVSLVGVGTSLSATYFVKRAVRRQTEITKELISDGLLLWRIAPPSKLRKWAQGYRSWAYVAVFTGATFWCFYVAICGIPFWAKFSR